MKKKQTYKELRDKWYALLKKKGFVDIETKAGNIRRGMASYEFTREKAKNQAGGPEAKLAYYTMAANFLNDYKFKTRLDRVIWEYHTEGISYRNISKLLKKVRVSNIGVNAVLAKVKELREIMKRMYMVGYKEYSE